MRSRLFLALGALAFCGAAALPGGPTPPWSSDVDPEATPAPELTAPLAPTIAALKACPVTPSPTAVFAVTIAIGEDGRVMDTKVDSRLEWFRDRTCLRDVSAAAVVPPNPGHARLVHLLLWPTREGVAASPATASPLRAHPPAGNGLPRPVMAQSIRWQLDEATRCYTGHTDEGGTVQGLLKVKLFIGPAGGVREVRVLEDTLRADEVSACVVKDLALIAFPSPADGRSAEMAFKMDFKGAEKSNRPGMSPGRPVIVPSTD